MVVGMIVGCSLLCSIQPYLWSYNSMTNKCWIRPHKEALWEAWSWFTEMIVFLVVPVVILIVNILVMREVWRMSNAGPAAAGPVLPASSRESTRGSKIGSESHRSSGCGGTKNAATNAMLLTVSFYVIFTTLPATLVYVLANAFPEFPPTFHGACADGVTTTQLMPTGGIKDPEVVRWHRYVVFDTVRKVVNEFCLSHYACNFFFYVVTGREFRLTLRRLCRGTVAEINCDAENGTPRRRHSGTDRTLLAKV